MKRLVVLITVAVALCAVLTAPQANGRPAAPAGEQRQRAVAGASGVAVTLTWLRNNEVGFDVGPSRATGYGKAEITSIVRGCPECSWFRVAEHVTNHQPANPLVQPNAARRGGFCWPWEMFPWSGDGCWNNMSSWNWGQIFDNFNYEPVWDQQSTVDRILGCYHGAYNSFTGGVVGKAIVGILLEMSDLVKFTPSGAAYTVLGGCSFSLFHW